MTLLALAMVLLVCMIGLSIWTEHKESTLKLEIELKNLEIELEEMNKRKDN